MRLTKLIGILAISITIKATPVQTQSDKVTSPDDNHAIHFKLSDGRLHYRLAFKDATILSA